MLKTKKIIVGIDETINLGLMKSTNAWTKEAVTVYLIATKIPEGYELQYKEGTADWSTGKQVDVVENNITVYARIYNPETQDELITNSITIDNIDKTPPTPPTQIIEVEKTSKYVIVRAEGGEDLESGVLGYQYSLDGINWTNIMQKDSNHRVETETDIVIYARTVDKNFQTSNLPTSKLIELPTVLIECEKVEDSESSFLGSSFIKRSNIESIRIADSLENHKLEEENCWDVSKKQNGEILAWYEDEDNNGYYEVTIAQEGGVLANENSSYLFSSLGNKGNIELSIKNLNNLKTSQVKNMCELFSYCDNLKTIDLRGIDTSNVKNISYMFQGCSRLINIDLGNFDTSNVENISGMFYGCESLPNIDVSNFNTVNATDMDLMFYGCKLLEKLDLSNFNTEKTTSIKAMFYDCNNLTELDISSFNTENITELNWLFGYCKNITQIDISNFDTSKVTNMSYMLHTCENLKKIYVGDNWTTENVSEDTEMFKDCYNLSGDIPYNAEYIDKTYATYIGGYLTYKQ